MVNSANHVIKAFGFSYGEIIQLSGKSATDKLHIYSYIELIGIDWWNIYEIIDFYGYFLLFGTRPIR